MSWLRRILQPERIAAPEAAPAGEELVRQGFDCELRGEATAADERYRAVPEGDPQRHQALFFLARRALEDRRVDEAIELLRGAVEQCPDEALYQLALGDALTRQLRYGEALAAYAAAREILPDALVICSNYAGALIHLNRREVARIELERMLELAPNAQELHFNLGGIYREYCRTDEAIAEYRRALELNPRHAPTYSNLLLELNMSATLSAEAIAAEHRGFGERFATAYLPPRPSRAWPRRLRVGYVSPDLRDHVVSKFLRPVLASHDHERFEIYCYHTYAQKDAVTEALHPLADHWLDCEDLSDLELAARIRADGIDILVDLAGHTAENRLITFTHKPAAVQATYLGYPNTTGIATIDYRITDAVADPPGPADALSSETLVRLPGSYFCFTPDPAAPDLGAPPAMRNGFVTFGCFNHFAKVSQPFLDLVAQVLHAVPRSRFLLKGRPLSLADVRAGVERHFERAGIDLARIDLRGWEPDSKSHLSIYNAVDIALDTFPYSGATTTCEALWMGVAVVSLAGDRHAGRMCASILTSVGLGDWVTNDPRAYLAKCVEASADVERLAELRRGMRERLKGCLLLNPAAFTRNLERCYVEMWERSVLAPEARRRSAQREALLAEARKQREAGLPLEAAETCRTLLQTSADDMDALQVLWDASFDAATPGLAIDALVKGLELRPQEGRLHYMLGCSLQAQGQVGPAVQAFRRSVQIEPNFAKAHNNLGCMLEAASQLDDALAEYEQAVRLDADLAQAHWNLGNLRWRRGERVPAIAGLRRALQAEPGNGPWRCRLAELLLAQDERDEALASFREATRLDSSDVRAWTGLAAALFSCGFVEQSIEAWQKALALDPENGAIESWLLFARHFHGANEIETLFGRHVEWGRRHARTLVRFTTRKPRSERPRLNVGYVVPGFLSELFPRFIEPVLRAHDKKAFALFCYSTAGESKEALGRVESLGCAVRELASLDDLRAADRIRADGIDILVDLAGHSGGGRMRLFGLKPAPIQITWLGYPNGTGLAAMDYRVTDALADPPGAESRYLEKLIRLPGGFLCFSPPSEAPAVAPAPQAARGYVTFGSFNNLAKLSAETAALWARVLDRVPGSKLVLKAHALAAAGVRERVHVLFGAHGIEPGRLELRPAKPSYEEHLDAYRDVDIALDVFPYNGGTTTCEALWMGVPVLTLAGTAAASRLGASILHSAGLAELVADSADAYVEIAARLAADLPGRQELRRALRSRLGSSPLLDAPAFARELEAAYREVWMAASSGKPNEPVGEPLRLHVGGRKTKQGWRIVDVKAGPGVDIVADCSDLSVIAGGSVEEIYACHVLEHLGYREKLPRALKEFHRVLKPQGCAKISVPDFEALCRLYADRTRNDEERLALMRMAFGGQMDEHDYHRVGLDFGLLQAFLLEAGFSRVERVSAFGLFDDNSNARYANTPISVNAIAYK